MFSVRVSVQRTGRPDGAGVPAEGQLLRVGARLGAEAATDVGDDHPHLRRVEAVDLGEQVFGRVGALARRVVDEATRRRSSSAAPERRSIGAAVIRWLTMRSATTTSHPLKSACCSRGEAHHDVRAVLGEQQHLVVDRAPRGRRRTAAARSRRRRGRRRRRRGPGPRRSPRRPAGRRSARCRRRRTAGASPRGTRGWMCGARPSSARSSPVNTASTPGAAFASRRVDRRVIRAWACGERT